MGPKAVTLAVEELEVWCGSRSREKDLRTARRLFPTPRPLPHGRSLGQSGRGDKCWSSEEHTTGVLRPQICCRLSYSVPPDLVQGPACFSLPSGRLGWGPHHRPSGSTGELAGAWGRGSSTPPSILAEAEAPPQPHPWRGKALFTQHNPHRDRQ